MPLIGWAAGITIGAFAIGTVALLGYRDLTWRKRQRRRRHVPIEFGGRRL